MISKNFIVDYYDCSEEFTAYTNNIIGLLQKFLEHSELKVECLTYRQFEPFGVTAIAILSESSVTLHTYVEEKIITLDIDICNFEKETKVLHAIQLFGNMLNSNRYTLKTLERGKPK